LVHVKGQIRTCSQKQIGLGGIKKGKGPGRKLGQRKGDKVGARETAPWATVFAAHIRTLTGGNKKKGGGKKSGIGDVGAVKNTIANKPEKKEKPNKELEGRKD